MSRKEEAAIDDERTPEARNEIVIEDLAKSLGDVKAVNGLTPSSLATCTTWTSRY